MMTVGMATRRPSASVVPSSALTALIAIKGPGCGGTRPCSTDRPAKAGIAMHEGHLGTLGDQHDDR